MAKLCCYPYCGLTAEWELIGVGTRELDHSHACGEHVVLLLQVDTQEYRLTRLRLDVAEPISKESTDDRSA